MNSKLLFIALLLAPLFVQAANLKPYERNESFICDPAVLAGPRDIVCCDTLMGKTCDETIDALLTTEQKTFLGDLTETILSFPEHKTAMPSCFATSMVLSGMPVADPFQYSGDTELVANLEKYYQEVSDMTDLQKGDVLVFDEQGEYFNMYDNELGHKNWKWEYGTLLAHAMVYLGEGLVVQKENAATAVSSVSTLDRAFERYSWGIEQTQHIKTMDYAVKKTKIVLRVYRKK